MREIVSSGCQYTILRLRFTSYFAAYLLLLCLREGLLYYCHPFALACDMSDHAEIETLAAKLGLQGQDLLDHLKQERQEARDERQLRRDELKEKEEQRKLEEKKLEVEEKRIEAEKVTAKQKLDQDREHEDQKLALEKEKFRYQLEQDEERRSGNLGKTKLPVFDESKDKFDAYIARFENYAKARKWKPEIWALQLSILLTGKALEAYDALTAEEQLDYGAVKEALLRRYSFTEEEFRRRFFSSIPEQGETPSQFGVRIMRLLARWLEYAKIPSTYDALRDLLVQEQVLRKCHQDLAGHLREQRYESYKNLTRAAEKYIDAHGGNITSPKIKSSKPNGKSQPKTPQDSRRVENDGKSSKSCKYCKRVGHDISECRKVPDAEGKKRCFNCLSTDHLVADCPKNDQGRTVVAGLHTTEDDEIEIMTTEIEGFVNHLTAGEVNGKSVTVMRDTGSNTIAVAECLVGNEQYTGEFWNCMLADRTTRRCPTAKIGVKTKYLSGEVEAAVMPSLLFDLIIGNVKSSGQKEALSGVEGSSGVVSQWDVVKESCEDSHMSSSGSDSVNIRCSSDSKDSSDSDLYGYLKSGDDMETKITSEIHRDEISSDLVQRRSQVVNKSEVRPPMQMLKEKFLRRARRVKDRLRNCQSDASGQKDIEDVKVVLNDQGDECDVISAHEQFSEKNCNAEMQSGPTVAVVTRSQAKKKKTNLPVSPQEEVCGETLIADQKADPSLQKFWDFARHGKVLERKRDKITYEIKNGILMRKFCRLGSDALKQVMVPKNSREKVLKVAHDSLLSGHCGTRRTTERVLSNFYWPRVTSDVVRYCRSCAICQKMSDKGRSGRAPLGQMPVISTPFSRVAVDLIGPITPASDEGHRWILTVVDYATRYPEAVALKAIDTITVAESLLEVFTRVGMPDEILSDQGTQFISELMSEVDRLLSIKQIKTTPYHPMCNGLVERFNGTLKRILKKLCSESPKQWHRYLPAVLYAYRSTAQESTGYSPFELVYGRRVKGPMDILKAYWTKTIDESDVKSVYKYVIDLKTRLGETCRLAQDELKKSQEAQKVYYDKKSKPKKLKVGDEVLLLLPTKNNKLLLQWKGPFTVVKKVNAVDYIISVRGKEKMFHCNMLKPYHQREKENGKGLASVVCISDGDVHDLHDEMIETCRIKPKETWKDVKVCDSLSDEQKKQVGELLRQFERTLTDVPGCTTVEKHEIKLTTDIPIRVKPYPIPFAMREVVQKEVEAMQDMGIVRKSKSPYSSPPVIVKKPDKSNRFCVNYKRLNAVTVFDGEPMPDAEELFLKLRGKGFRSKIDLSKGYWQIPLHTDSIPYTAFSTPQGLYEFTKMPFGLVNSAASFNRLMRKVLGSTTNVGCFVDDLIVYTDTWEQHVDKLREVLQKLADAGLTVRPSKCVIGFSDVEFLGHCLSLDEIKPRSEKVQEILQVPRPVTKRQVKSFLALANYYSKFICKFSDTAQPLLDLTKKFQPNKVQWGPAQEKSFQEIKLCLSRDPILKIFDPNKVIFVQTDSSDYALGAAMLQEYQGVLHPVRYLSRKLKPAEVNYTIMEKECLAIVWAINKLKVYLYGTEFVLLTDNRPLQFLKESNIQNARVTRWSLALQDWTFRVQSIAGVENFAADCLSRV